MAENNDKGKFLEEIVASFYRNKNLKIEKNVFLKPLDRNGRKREIDILIISKISTNEIYIPIECKNHKKRVGSKEIDAFAGKLDYLGLFNKNVTCKAIFVSVNGFTPGAKDVANHFDIKLLTLKGLSKDRLSLELFDAIQSLTYIFPIFKSYSIINSLVQSNNYEHIIFYDSNRKYKGTLVDIIFECWSMNKIDLKLGIQNITIENSRDLYCLQDNELHQCVSIKFEVLVVACVLNFKGKMSEEILFNNDKVVDNLRVKANFEEKEKYTYIFFDCEESLENYKINRKEHLKIDFGKVKVPKVRMNKLFYPLSKKVKKEYDKFLLTKDENIFNIELEKLESNMLNSMLDEI